MDTESLINTAIDDCFSIVHHLKDATYVSTLVYYKNNLTSKRTNNFGGWEDIFFEHGMHNDCLLLKVAKSISNLAAKETSVIIWERAVDDDDPIQQQRHQHGLFSGISMLVKPTNEITFVISACTSKDTNPHIFHKSFLSKREKFISVVNNLG